MAKKKRKSKIAKEYQKQTKRIEKIIERLKEKDFIVDYKPPKSVTSRSIESMKKIKSAETLIKRNKVYYVDEDTGELKKAGMDQYKQAKKKKPSYLPIVDNMTENISHCQFDSIRELLLFESQAAIDTYGKEWVEIQFNSSPYEAIAASITVGTESKIDEVIDAKNKILNMLYNFDVPDKVKEQFDYAEEHDRATIDEIRSYKRRQNKMRDFGRFF